MRVHELLRELVLRPSTPSDDVRPILDFVSRLGRDLGARPVPVANGDRPALLLAWGRPRLLFSGHLDTVPLSGTWKSTPGEVRGGRLFGRGSTDMKAGCAAMLAAAAARKHRDGFGILFTTDEETRMKGAQAAVAQGLLSGVETVIVGEPTGLRPNLGQKGILWLAVTTEGKSAHASMPWAGENAIAAMARVVQALRPLAGGTPRRAALLTASPDVIQGGVANNVVPARCTLSLDVRHAPRLAARKARAKVEAAIRKSGAPAKVEVLQEIPPVTSRPGAIARRLKALTRKAYGVCDFGTEAAHFAPAGAACLVLGPGLPHHCHVTDESVELAQVEEAVRLYGAALEALEAPGKAPAATRRS